MRYRDNKARSLWHILAGRPAVLVYEDHRLLDVFWYLCGSKQSRRKHCEYEQLYDHAHLSPHLSSKFVGLLTQDICILRHCGLRKSPGFRGFHVGRRASVMQILQRADFLPYLSAQCEGATSSRQIGEVECGCVKQPRQSWS